MQEIGVPDDTLHPWADARRWLLVVPVALLPFLVALVALIILKTALSSLGVPMFPFAYLVATAGSAYFSVTLSTGIVPRRGWVLGRAMSIAYVLISAAVLFLLLVVDNHPPQAVPENETPELIQMLAVAGLGFGAVGAHLRAMVTSSEPG
jgi:hypothetical protein